MIATMPRRSDHEGTRPRKVKGRDLYAVRVMLGGKLHQCYGKTAADATDKKNRLVRDWNLGLEPLESKYTVGQWLDDWLRLYTGHLAPRTVESYSDTVRLYLKPALGNRQLAKLKADHIQAMLEAAVGPRGPLSPTTRRYVYAVLRISLGRAVKVGRLHRNVATLVSPPPKGPRAIPFLTGDESAALLAALATDRHKAHKALILVALTAGLREGEVLGLTWPAVSLAQGTLEVRGQLTRGTRLLAEPKRESRRRVDLPPETVAALTELQRRQKRQRIGVLDWDPRDFVFTNRHGQAYYAGMPGRVLMRVLAGIGLPERRLHSLRHTFVSLSLQEGVPLETVSKLAGHKSVATTADIYGHLTDRSRADAAERMGRALRRKAT